MFEKNKDGVVNRRAVVLKMQAINELNQSKNIALQRRDECRSAVET
ncbi:MAG: hypothetical protein Pyrs2KO_34720 [Pyruvatibacter sp.]